MGIRAGMPVGPDRPLEILLADNLQFNPARMQFTYCPRLFAC